VIRRLWEYLRAAAALHASDAEARSQNRRLRQTTANAALQSVLRVLLLILPLGTALHCTRRHGALDTRGCPRTPAQVRICIDAQLAKELLLPPAEYWPSYAVRAHSTLVPGTSDYYSSDGSPKPYPRLPLIAYPDAGVP
jgi:hypothetical protein